MVRKSREAVHGLGSSLLGALTVSTIMTAIVAVPLGLDAASDDGRPAGIDEAISADDARFPAAVPLADAEIELLASDELADEPLVDEAEVAGVFVTPTAVATDDPTPEPVEQLAILIPTPTSTPEEQRAPDRPAATPPSPETTEQSEPEPTVAPTPRSPTPDAPPDDDEPPPATPRPTATEEPEPTLEPAPTAEQAPTPDPDGPSTDVYAFVSGDALREDQVGSLELKTVNGGSNETTGVTVSVSASGGSILSVSPGRADWTCTGTDAAWQCTGPTLEAVSSSRGIMTLLPHDQDLTVSVAVDHALIDEEPANNSFSTAVPVVPNPTTPDELDQIEEEPDPTPTAVEPTEPVPDPEPDPTEPPEPVEPTPPPTPSPTPEPSDPAEPGGDGTNGPVPDATPSPTVADATGDDSAGGAAGGGQAGEITDVVATEQDPAIEPERPEVVTEDERP